MNRLNGRLVKCLKKENQPEYTRLIGFEFTEYSSLGGRIKKFPELSFNDQGPLILSMPLFRREREFIAPAFAVSVVLKISAVCVDPENPDGSLQTWGVCYDLTKGILQPEQLELPFTNTKGQLILVGAALRYYADDRIDYPVLKEKWVPTGIVAVGYDNRIPVLDDE